jgi:hypothetical protein
LIIAAIDRCLIRVRRVRVLVLVLIESLAAAELKGGSERSSPKASPPKKWPVESNYHSRFVRFDIELPQQLDTRDPPLAEVTERHIVVMNQPADVGTAAKRFHDPLDVPPKSTHGRG